MAGSAGSIYVDLLLKDAKFQEGTKRASRALKDFGDTATKAGKIAGAALAAATAALTALTVRQFGVIDSTIKLSRSLGVANESFQALATVADEAGVNQEQLGTLITKSQKSIIEAARGMATYKKAFDVLGLSAKDLIKLAPDEQFAKIQEALSGIENPTLRTATALEIFGKQGRAALNITEDFAEKLREAREFNDKFNISVNEIDSRKVEEANDTFGRLGKAIGGIGNTIAVETSPLVTELAKALLGAGIDGQTASNAIKGALEGAGVVIDTVRKATLGLKAIFLQTASAALSVAAKFNEVRIAFAEFALKVRDSENNRLSLKNAQVALENVKNLAGAAADQYAALQDEAGKFVTTSEKIAKIQEDAQKRAEEAEAKFGKNGAGGGVDLGEVDEKRAKTLKSITEDLEKQAESVRIQNDLFGESEAIIDRQILQYEIMQRLKSEGVTLTETELAALYSKLDLLESEKQLNIELQEAEKARQKAADELLKQQEEQQKLLEESIQKVREDLADGLIDAATGAGNFADKMKEVAKNIALAVIKAQLLKVITDATGGSSIGGSGGSGLWASLFSFLPSFDVGTDYVPYDMVAKVHKGERILTAQENMNYQNGGGVTMNVYTPNADSFRASERQITRRVKNRMAMA